MDYFLVLDPQHYFAWSLVLSFAVMSCSLSCLCASVPVLSLWYCSCCCSLASCSLSVHQSCLQWQNIAPYHEFFDRSLKNLHSSPLQFQQHLELIHALSSLHIKTVQWIRTWGHLSMEWCTIHIYIITDTCSYIDRSQGCRFTSVELAQAS